LFLSLQACNDNSNSGSEKDPCVTQSPSENLPDAVKLVNDSVIVPDATPYNGRQLVSSDPIQKNKH
jgi:hypothetical protein